DWADRTITSDLIVTAGGAFSSGGSSMPMDDSVGDRIVQTFPGSIVSPVRFRYVSFRTAYVQLEVMDARSYYEANQRNGHAPPELAYYHRLADEPDTALISDNFASTYGVRPGDVIALPASSGPRQLKVIGTYDDPSWPRGTVVIHRIRKFEPGEISSCL